jgi:hypothetical protein
MKASTVTTRRSRRHNWAVLGSIALLIATIAIGIWLAFAVEAPTTVTVDQESGAIAIEGPESEFVGFVTGSYEGKAVTISGLPAVEPVMEYPIAWRALCSLRKDDSADWSQAATSLRGYLTSEKIDDFCAPFS